MNFNQISQGINVVTTIEEEQLLDKLSSLNDYNEFSERQQIILDNLVKKDIIKQVFYKGKCYLVYDKKPY